jgi:hypothetical protein
MPAVLDVWHDEAQVGCPHTPLMLYQQAVSCNGRLVVAVSIMTNKVIGVACMHMRTVLRDWSVPVCVVSNSETTVGYHSAGSAGLRLRAATARTACRSCRRARPGAQCMFGLRDHASICGSVAHTHKLPAGPGGTWKNMQECQHTSSVGAQPPPPPPPLAPSPLLNFALAAVGGAHRYQH